MSISTSRLSYLDCYAVYDKAVADEEGVRVLMPDLDKATHFRMRMHTARKINRKDNADVYEVGHPMHAASEYDPFVIRLRPASNGSWWVYVQHQKIDLNEVQPLSQVQELLPSPRQEMIEAKPAPLMIEHVRRRI